MRALVCIHTSTHTHTHTHTHTQVNIFFGKREHGVSKLTGKVLVCPEDR